MSSSLENALDEVSVKIAEGGIPAAPMPLATAMHSMSDRVPVDPAAPFVGGSIMQIPVNIQVVIGSVRLPLARVAELRSGSIVTLDQKLGAPATILVNGREVAKGDIFVLDGEGAQIGITVTEVIGPVRPNASS